MQGKFDQAVTDFNKALKLAPNDSFTLLHLGYALAGKSDASAAITTLTRYLQTYPNDSEALMSRGLAELRLGQSDVAQKDFDTAVRLVPGLKVRIAEESKKVQSVAKVAAGTSKTGAQK